MRVIGDALVDVSVGTATHPGATEEQDFGEARLWCLDRRCASTSQVEAVDDGRLGWTWGDHDEVLIYPGHGSWVPLTLPPATADDPLRVNAWAFRLAADGSATTVTVESGKTCHLTLWWSPQVGRPLSEAARSPAYDVPETSCSDLIYLRTDPASSGWVRVHGRNGLRLEFTRDGDTWTSGFF